MDKNIVAQVSLLIEAPKQKVWEALTTPEIIKKYFFNTHVTSTWTIGSPITFSGEWEGQPYLDKGVILQHTKPDLLQYSYLSSWSQLEDVPENYGIITYHLHEEKGVTLLRITQAGHENDVQKQHSEQNWMNVMMAMKKLIE
ncbi:MAG: SRPBCC domain-containing protein [Bacteroidetes bacterium]|nr:MAG: SRPBCC domain-containing protein [Bacteroidota bacterium]